MDKDDAECRRQECLLFQYPQDDEEVCDRGVYKVGSAAHDVWDMGVKVTINEAWVANDKLWAI